MILPEKFVWFWIRRALAGHFFRIRMRGADDLRHLRGPAVLFLNHSGWWDTFICVFIKHFFKLKAYGMMEEKNLKKASFLKSLGVYGIDLESPRRAVAGMRKTVSLLESGAVIFIFPQGRHVPFHARPVEFRPGLEWLMKKVPEAKFYSVAVRYEHLWESRPIVLLNVAPVESPDLEKCRIGLESRMDQISEDIIAGRFAPYETLLQGRLSMNKKWERVKSIFTGKPFDPYNT